MPKTISILRTSEAQRLARMSSSADIPIADAPREVAWSSVTAKPLNFGLVSLVIDPRLVQKCLLTNRIFLFRPTRSGSSQNKKTGFRMYFAGLHSVPRTKRSMVFEAWYSQSLMEMWLVVYDEEIQETPPVMKVSPSPPLSAEQAIVIDDGYQEVCIHTQVR